MNAKLVPDMAAVNRASKVSRLDGLKKRVLSKNNFKLVLDTTAFIRADKTYEFLNYNYFLKNHKKPWGGGEGQKKKKKHS